MSRNEQIEQELAKGAKGIQDGNEGLARVCARRAVTLGTRILAARSGAPGWTGDAMFQLRRIQGEETFPLEIREAAQRLVTTVTQQDRVPMSTDPIADARLILAHLDQLP
jgi:hypothetical protein